MFEPVQPADFYTLEGKNSKRIVDIALTRIGDGGFDGEAFKDQAMYTAGFKDRQGDSDWSQAAACYNRIAEALNEVGEDDPKALLNAIRRRL